MTPATYDSAVAFLAQVDQAAAGCIVTDVRMPEMSGLELVRRLRERKLAYPVIVMTGHADVPLAVEAMKAGGRRVPGKAVRRGKPSCARSAMR